MGASGTFGYVSNATSSPFAVSPTSNTSGATARAVGAYVGVAGFIQISGLVTALFTTAGGQPNNGDNVYLANTADDGATGAGKLTATAPSPGTTGFSISSVAMCVDNSLYASVKTCVVELQLALNVNIGLTTGGTPVVTTSQGHATVSGVLQNVSTATFANTQPLAATPPNVDWTKAQLQTLTLVASITVTMTSPLGPGTFQLRVIQGGAGSFLITWPATVKWVGSNPPVLSTAVGASDIINLTWDGTNYWCTYGNNYG